MSVMRGGLTLAHTHTHTYSSTQKSQICTHAKAAEHVLRHLCVLKHTVHRYTWKKRHCQQQQLGLWVLVVNKNTGLGLQRSVYLWTAGLIYQHLFGYMEKQKSAKVLVKCFHFIIHMHTIYSSNHNLIHTWNATLQCISALNAHLNTW